MDQVIETVRRSNQRGGRMLSLVDLVEAQTLTLEQAAWLTERIENGSSFLVGANPGGAGKTAVMGALLTMVPEGARVHITDRRGAWRKAGPGDCVVSYEISPASYEAYIWGENVRQLADLGLNGARIVANLHADSVEEAWEQLTEDNGLADNQAEAFELFIPIRMETGPGKLSRTVDRIYAIHNGRFERVGRRPELSERGAEIKSFLERSGEAGVRRIEELRKTWLE